MKRNITALIVGMGLLLGWADLVHAAVTGNPGATLEYRFGQYNTATNIYWCGQAGTTPQLGCLTGLTWTCNVSKDGANYGVSTNTATEIQATGTYKLILTASEMLATDVIVRCTAADTFDAVFDVSTVLALGRVVVGGYGNGTASVDISNNSLDGKGMSVTGVGSSPGMYVAGGNTGVGMEITAGMSGASGLTITATGNGDGIYAVGGVNGTGAGAVFEGGSTSGSGLQLQGHGTGAGVLSGGGATGPGGYFAGGATSGVGMNILSQGTNSAGMTVSGFGSGAGITATGGATGAGISAVGGATSGYAISAVASAGDSSGLYASGNGAGAGAYFAGGATGRGITAQGGATSGDGMAAFASSGNSYGLIVTGTGTGSGLQANGGATGSGAYFQGGATSGNGLVTAAQTLGHGLWAYGVGSAKGGLYAQTPTPSMHGVWGDPDIYPIATTVWNAVEATEPTAGPTGSNTYGELLQLLTHRFYAKVTQTATSQKIYKWDSSTVLATGTTSDDGVTQVKGRQQ